MASASKPAAVLLLLLTIILVIFSLPVTVRGDGFDTTPSHTSEISVQPTNIVTTTQTETLTPTNTSVAHLQITNTVVAAFTATKVPSKTRTMTPKPKATVIPTASPVETEDLPFGYYVEDEVLVKTKTRKHPQNFLSDLKGLNAEIRTELPDLGVLVVKVPPGSVPEFIANIKLSPDIVYAEPNYLVSIADTVPNDGSWGFQYGPAAIRAPQGWDLSTGSSAVTIAVIDTGIDQSHPDLAAKIVPGYDFANNDSDPQDDNGHGTHVAGIAAASANNGVGIAGISWGARLMPIKVLNSSGNGSYANAALGIIWAADNGAQVINLSFGGSASSATLQAAVEYAYSKNVTVVAAAGNSGSNLVLYPAHYPNVIAVAATDASNMHAGFSNYGPEMSVVAPGVSIYSSLYGGGYGYKSGTSMSVPMVSGAAAILAGLPGNNNPSAIAWQLQSSALDLGAPGFDTFYGYGLIQLDDAIRAALPSLTSTPTITSTATTTLTPTLVPSLTVQSTSTKTVIITPTSTSAANATITATLALTPRIGNVATVIAHPWILLPPILFFSSETPSSMGTVTNTPTVTVTIALCPNYVSNFTNSPELPKLVANSSSEIQIQQNRIDASLLLPCVGILFILAGIMLAGVAITLQKKS